MAPAANNGWYKLIFYWLHETAACRYFGVDLERDSIIIRFPAYRTGLLTHLLTCFTLLSFSLLLGQNYSKSNFLLPFAFLDKNFQSPNFSSLFSLDKNIPNPASISQKYSTTKNSKIPISVLAAKSIQFYKNILNPTLFLTKKNSLFLPTNYILLPLDSKQSPPTLASVLACADSADELRF